MHRSTSRRWRVALFVVFFLGIFSISMDGFLALPASGAVSSNQTGATEGIGMEQLLAEALENNFALRSAADAARALRAEVPFAGSLDDPRLSLNIANLPTDTFDFDQEPMTQKQIVFAQKVPWFGTLDLSGQRAEMLAREQEFLVIDKSLELIRQLKHAVYDLGFTEYSLKVNEELSTIVSQMIEVAETRYATGEGLQQDILQGQVRLTELLETRVRLESSRQALRGRIGALLNRDALFTEHIEGQLSEKARLPESAVLTSVALSENPVLAARRIIVQRAEVEVELARKKYLPNMDFKVSYGQREDDPVSGKDRADFFSAGVTVNLPVWQKGRQDSHYQATLERLESARNGVLNYERTLPHRIDGLIAEFEGASSSQDLLREAIVIQNEQLADSSLAAYSVGKVEFSTMLNARVRLLQSRLAARRYVYETHKKLAELEELIGRPIAEIALVPQ